MDIANARTLARTFMDAYGLQDWNFTFDHAKRRLGQTNFTTHTITLSAPLVQASTWEQVRATTLHEIAHALVGPEHGHDAVWKAQARTLGIDPRATAHDAPKLPAKYVGTCPRGHTVERYRRPRGLHSCATCDPRFNRDYLLTWSQQY